jgi:hypothetical protein
MFKAQLWPSSQTLSARCWATVTRSPSGRLARVIELNGLGVTFTPLICFQPLRTADRIAPLMRLLWSTRPSTKLSARMPS